MPVKIKIHARIRSSDLQVENQPDSFSGSLYLEIGDTFFPAEGGTVYVLEELAKWMENAMRIFLPETEVENACAESPYAFGVCRVRASDDVTMRLYHCGDLQSTQTVSYRRYLAALRGAAKNVLFELRSRALNAGPYAENLRDRLTHLERLEEHIKAHGLP